MPKELFIQDDFVSRVNDAIEKIRQLNNKNFPSVTEEKLQKTLEYSREFLKWNRSYNMTALVHPDDFLVKHIFDCLAVLPFFSQKSLIDIGTGGGLPGVLIAIFYPEKKVALLDSVGKKTRFLFHIKTQLQLDNIEIFHQRAEQHTPAALYDAVTSRAFSSISQFLSLTNHMLAPDGYFYALKGQQPDEELSELGKEYKVNACRQIYVPSLDADRHLVTLSKIHY